jgi:16S rRNA (uracil1498-N3)-methyltransferase
MHRFFLHEKLLHEKLVEPGQLLDLSQFAHQLQSVLRLRAGDRVLILDGSGFEFITELHRVERGKATGMVLSMEPNRTEPAVRLTLFQCSLKADKFEWVLQKGTELGVTCFVPVVSQRSIVRPGQALLRKYDRWRSIIREAAEQSQRGRLPELEQPLTWTEAVSAGTGLKLMPWENAKTASNPAGLGDVVHEHLLRDPSASVSLLIGPEGGISAEEALQAREAGWQAVSLGPRILRAETAALASVTIALERAGQLR